MNVNNINKASFVISKEVQDWEVAPKSNLKVTITGAAAQAEAVVLFIHGGPNLDYDDAIKPQDAFFTDLAEKQLLVIAPHYPYDALAEPNVDYRDLIDGTAQKIMDKYSLPLYVISHSYGAHFTGRTLLRDNALSQNVKKWVVMSGTTHHGAGSLRRGLSDIVADANNIPRDKQNNIIWEESPSSLNTNDKNTFEMTQHVSLSLIGVTANDRERFTLDGFKDVDDVKNSLISKELNKEFSIHHHLPKLKRHFPVLVLHPTEDSAVTVDVGLKFFKALQKNGWPVQFTTEENSPHNWMKKGTPHNEDRSYQQLFGTLSRFLMDGSLEKTEVENAISTAETYLEKNPDLNYMELFKRFHKNEEISFTSFDNSSRKLAREIKNGEYSKKTSQGIEATKKVLDLSMNPFGKNLEKINLMIEETEKLITKLDEEADLDEYSHRVDVLLPKLKRVKTQLEKNLL